MALKPRYVIDGITWLPLGRAATLLGTSTAGLKKLMGANKLEWRNVPKGRSLLVEEAGVLRMRAERLVGVREAARRAAAILRTANEKGRSQLMQPPDRVARQYRSDVFVPTWDPSPDIRPVSGRDPAISR